MLVTGSTGMRFLHPVPPFWLAFSQPLFGFMLNKPPGGDVGDIAVPGDLNPALSQHPPGLQFTPNTLEGGRTVNSSHVGQYIATMYRYAVGIVAIVAIVMTVYGGFRYLIGASMGDIAAGKKIIQDAIAGLMIALGAYLILQTVNPMITGFQSTRLSVITSEDPDNEDDSPPAEGHPEEAGAVNAPAAGPGPAMFCRQTLTAHPRVRNSTVWCNGCSGRVPCGPRSPRTPDPACQALIGPCGGSFGRFLKATTSDCRSKTFHSFEGLDGGTYGIIGSMHMSFTRRMASLRTIDPAVYARVMTAGHNRPLTNQSLCLSNQTDHGWVCNPDYLAMLRTALPTRAFAIAQLQDAYRKYTQRVSIASSHGFRSEFGQAMWATVMNNPGRCGAGFGIVFQACSAVQNGTESQRIDCFLQKFAELGCRGGVPGATRRANAIRQMLRGVSRTETAPAPTLAQLEACIPQY